MKDNDIFGKDKVMHLIVCIVLGFVSTLFAMGAALGKEYGDKNATGNHWCWWDLSADVIGIIIGTSVRFLMVYLTGVTHYLYIL